MHNANDVKWESQVILKTDVEFSDKVKEIDAQSDALYGKWNY